MSPITIHPDLQDLILPLTAEEYRWWEQNMLGLEGFSAGDSYYLRMSPSLIGNHWYFISLMDMSLEIEDYTKHPIVVSRIRCLPFLQEVLAHTSFALKGSRQTPLPNDFHTKAHPSKANATPPSTTLYVIQATRGGPVKIGVSDDVDARIRSFQMGCPFPLRIIRLIPNVSPRLEKTLHRHFASARLHGEWFAKTILPALDLFLAEGAQL